MKICLIACLDTKGAECDFLKKQFEQKHHTLIIINTGIFPSQHKADIAIHQIVGEENKAALENSATSKIQANAIQLICANAPKTIPTLLDLHSFDVVIGMGGSNGTLISTTIMKLFPDKTRKICISTLAPAHLALDKYKADNIEMVPAIVDLSGLNIITQCILKYVANLVIQKTPALEYKPTNNLSTHENAIKFSIAYLDHFKIIPELQKQSSKTIAITMFGNTTICVEGCHKQLTESGYHVIIFHATGIGGEIMRYLIEQQCIKAGVLDITTTELADLICDGSMSASPERFYAPSKSGIPHLIVPGCLDMVNFIPKHLTPARYANRKFLSWGADMQLMRTNAEENIQMGEFLAKLANQSKDLVEFVLPNGGFSVLGQEGRSFFDNQTDMTLIDTIKKHCGLDHVTTINQNINHCEVVDALVRKIHFMIQKSRYKSIAEWPHLNANNSSVENKETQQSTNSETSLNTVFKY